MKDIKKAKVTYDVYTNTIIVDADECVVDSLSESLLLDAITDRYKESDTIRIKVAVSAVKAHISEINLTNMIITKLDLTGAVVKGTANFYASRFIGDVMCMSTLFLDDVIFLCSTFENMVHLDYSVFEKELDFSMAEGKSISIAKAYINGTTLWEGMDLTGTLNIERSNFKEDLIIRECSIDDGIYMQSIKCRSNCVLEDIETVSIDATEAVIKMNMTVRKIHHNDSDISIILNDRRKMNILTNYDYLPNHRDEKRTNRRSYEH